MLGVVVVAGVGDILAHRITRVPQNGAPVPPNAGCGTVEPRGHTVREWMRWSTAAWKRVTERSPMSFGATSPTDGSAALRVRWCATGGPLSSYGVATVIR